MKHFRNLGTSILLAVVLAVAVASGAASSTDRRTPKRFAGAYSGAIDLGDGTAIRNLTIVNADGTAHAWTTSGELTSANWRQTGPRSFVVSHYWFSFDPETREAVAVTKATVHSTLDKGMTFGTCEYFSVSAACENGPRSCPDPAGLPEATTPLPLPCTFTRLPID